MNPVQGLAANLVTSLVVIFASRLGMPVSTTHVSSCAIIGIGASSRGDAQTGGLHWTTVRHLLLAWVVTLPVSAGLAAGIYWLAN